MSYIQQRSYAYGEVFASLLGYLNTMADRIKNKHPELPRVNVCYLDSIPDFAKLPEGDILFMSSWTMETSPDAYGDIHEVILGFAAVNDMNGHKLEEIYMNFLMGDVSNKNSKGHTKIPIYSRDGSQTIGILVFSPVYYTNEPAIHASRVFRSVSVTLFSPQRLEATGRESQ